MKKGQIVEIKVMLGNNPFDRMNLIEKPLAEFLNGFGSVIGGVSVIKVIEGVRQISHCNLDLLLIDMKKGMEQIRTFFENHFPETLVEVKYTKIDGKEEIFTIEP